MSRISYSCGCSGQKNNLLETSIFLGLLLVKLNLHVNIVTVSNELVIANK